VLPYVPPDLTLKKSEFYTGMYSEVSYVVLYKQPVPPKKYSVTICSTRFDIKEICILHGKYIHEFHVLLYKQPVSPNTNGTAWDSFYSIFNYNFIITCPKVIKNIVSTLKIPG
jgi:hypothetical protein